MRLKKSLEFDINKLITNVQHKNTVLTFWEYVIVEWSSFQEDKETFRDFIVSITFLNKVNFYDLIKYLTEEIFNDLMSRNINGNEYVDIADQKRKHLSEVRLFLFNNIKEFLMFLMTKNYLTMVNYILKTSLFTIV